MVTCNGIRYKFQALLGDSFNKLRILQRDEFTTCFSSCGVKC